MLKVAIVGTIAARPSGAQMRMATYKFQGSSAMPKYWALGAALAASIGCSFVANADDATIPEEYAKLIQAHSRIGSLDGGFFGDHVELSTGGLDIVQTDIDPAGHNRERKRTSITH